MHVCMLLAPIMIQQVAWQRSLSCKQPVNPLCGAELMCYELCAFAVKVGAQWSVQQETIQVGRVVADTHMPISLSEVRRAASRCQMMY